MEYYILQLTVSFAASCFFLCTENIKRSTNICKKKYVKKINNISTKMKSRKKNHMSQVYNLYLDHANLYL